VAERYSCIDSTKINIYVGIQFEMPDAFTPNGDNLNEKFYPVINGGTVTEFRIYDRWGKLVHDNPNEGWDGTFKDKLQQNEIYNYFIKVSNSKEDVTKFGTFTLIL